MLTRAILVRRLLRRRVLTPDEQQVGVLLPPSVGGAVVNAALGLDCRVAVNLNYTLTSDVNGYRQEGFAPFDRNIRRGRRLSAARAYLIVIDRRPGDVLKALLGAA